MGIYCVFILLIFSAVNVFSEECLGIPSDETLTETCTVILNEINIDTPSKVKNKDFIEIRSFCNGMPKSISLQGYKIIGMTTGTSTQNQKVSINLVINPCNWKTNPNGMLTIGGPGVTNADVIIPNPYVKFREALTKGPSILKFYVTGGIEHLGSIAIVYAKDNSFSNIVLNEKTPFIPVNSDIKNTIQDHLVDLLVYGKKAPFDKCGFFEDIYPGYENKKYVLREYDVIDNIEIPIDYTLNRCGVETEGFHPEKIKLGKATPAEENDCEGTRFILEDHLLEVTAAVQSHDFSLDRQEYDELLETTEAQCSSSMDSSQYLSTSVHSIQSEVISIMRDASADTCTSLDLDPEGPVVLEEVERGNARKRKISSEGIDYSTDYEWSTTKFFKLVLKFLSLF